MAMVITGQEIALFKYELDNLNAFVHMKIPSWNSIQKLSWITGSFLKDELYDITTRHYAITHKHLKMYIFT